MRNSSPFSKSGPSAAPPAFLTASGVWGFALRLFILVTTLGIASWSRAQIQYEPLSNAPIEGELFTSDEGIFYPPEMSRPWWTWQILPTGTIFHAYWASNREARIGCQFVDRVGEAPVWDIALGGRIGLLRYGTEDATWPEGWQIDLEGAAFPRLTLDYWRDLVAVDFKFGVPISFRQGPWEAKLAYYHLCAHLGDEYWEKHPDFERINYVRDAFTLAGAVYPHPDIRLYAEVGYAFYVAGGSLPWECQFGADCGTTRPTGIRGAPFFAINGRLRQEVDWGGNLTVQAGWMWRGVSGHTLRGGFYFSEGMSDQYEFFQTHEQLIGGGLWADF